MRLYDRLAITLRGLRLGSRDKPRADHDPLRTDGERSIVEKGLKQGERVVTRGQLRLGPKVKVQIGKPAAAEAS